GISAGFNLSARLPATGAEAARLRRFLLSRSLWRTFPQCPEENNGRRIDSEPTASLAPALYRQSSLLPNHTTLAYPVAARISDSDSSKFDYSLGSEGSTN